MGFFFSLSYAFNEKKRNLLSEADWYLFRECLGAIKIEGPQGTQLKEKGNWQEETLEVVRKALLPDQAGNLYRPPCPVPARGLSNRFCPSCSHLIALVRRPTRRAFQ